MMELYTRSQFLKTAAFSRVIKKYEGAEKRIVCTGKYYDQNMSDVFFTEMEIPLLKYKFQTGRKMNHQHLEEIEEILFNEKSDLVLVCGDTNSILKYI